MKASWIETQQIEGYLHGQNPMEEEAIRVKMLCDTDFYAKVHWQKAACAYINAYGQEALRQEIVQAQKAVFERSAYEKFRQIIQNIFS